MKKVTSICFCGLFVAVFFAFGNLIPPIQMISGVPLTLQIFVISLIAYLLDFKYSLLTYITILVMTVCGIPMMSSLSAGVYALTGPTAGYIYGWILLISLIAVGKRVARKFKGKVLKPLMNILFAVLGLIAVYLCGAVWISVLSSSGIKGFVNMFIANVSAFIMFDILKVIAGYAVFNFIKKII